MISGSGLFCNHPHSMGAWSADSRTRVITMDSGDFRSTELSVTVPDADELTIRVTPTDGEARDLRSPVKVAAGTIVDGSVMSAAALDAFLADAIRQAKADGVRCCREARRNNQRWTESPPAAVSETRSPMMN